MPTHKRTVSSLTPELSRSSGDIWRCVVDAGSDLKHFFHIARSPSRPDVLVLLITFSLTVLVDLVAAVLVGVVLALVLRRWAKN